VTDENPCYRLPMSAHTAFKNALQALTTTIVKAEAVQGVNAAKFETMAAESVPQRRALNEARAALLAEFNASASETTLPYENWFGQTLARAEALFGPVASDV
jgi:hypothetical protein